MTNMNDEKEKLKKAGLVKLIDFQDTFLKNKEKAEEIINHMPCWMLDEDHMILLRQKATQEMYSPFFDEGYSAGVLAERERVSNIVKARGFLRDMASWTKVYELLFPQPQEQGK